MDLNLTVADLHTSRSDAVLRRVLGGMSVFTMVMTIPQVLIMWVGHLAAGGQTSGGVPR